VIFRPKQPDGPPVPVGRRYQQALDTGEVALHPFSQLELDAVTLEPESVPPGRARPYLQPVTPVLARFLELSAGPAAVPPPGPAGSGGAQLLVELGGVVVSLERHGFVHPGPPAPPVGRMQVEFAGLAAAPDGQVRRVALAGDLGIVTRMRGRVLFVAEVLSAADPASPDLAPDRWALAGRVYTPYEMPGCLVERPPGRDGGLPPLMLMQEGNAALALMDWLGADVPSFLSALQARAEGKPDRDAPQPTSVWPEEQPGEVATADIAPRLRRLRQLRLMQPQGDEVLVRSLVVGSGEAGYWLLDGDWLDRAVGVSVLQLGDRLDKMLRAASGGPDGPAGPAGPDGQANGHSPGAGQPG
jgi:hypothetical protein